MPFFWNSKVNSTAWRRKESGQGRNAGRAIKRVQAKRTIRIGRKVEMSFTYANVSVWGQKTFKAMEMLENTGSTYITLDSKTLGELGLLATAYKVDLTVADGGRVEARLLLAEVETGGRRSPAFVAEVETPTPLLRVYALERLGFKVNPKTGALEGIAPEGGYLLRHSHA